MTFSQPLPEELTRWTMCSCDSPNGCGHAQQVSRLEAELEGRRAWCSKLGHQMGKTTSLLHHAEQRYAKLVSYNEGLLAEIALCFEDLREIAEGPYTDEERMTIAQEAMDRLASAGHPSVDRSREVTE